MRLGVDGGGLRGPHFEGEGLHGQERVVTATAAGRCCALAAGPVGTVVEADELVGWVEQRGTRCPISSAFSGRIMGFLVVQRERARDGRPVAWLRVDGSPADEA